MDVAKVGLGLSTFVVGSVAIKMATSKWNHHSIRSLNATLDTPAAKGLLFITSLATIALGVYAATQASVALTCSRIIIGGIGLIHAISYEKAAKHVLQTSQANADRLHQLGIMHKDGLEGLEQSDSLALSYYEQAAQLGNPFSAYNAALQYYYGEGTNVCHEKAAKYFLQAAIAKDSDALTYLGVMHAHGLGGLTKSDIEALAYHERSAELGNATGAMHAGLQHYYGHGTTRSYEKAAKYLLQSAETNQPESLNMLGIMHQNGYGGLEKSDALALSYYERAAQFDNPEGAANAAYMYYKDGTTLSYEKAAKYFLQAKTANYPDAYNQLGFMHLSGLGGLEQSESIALSYFEQAAELGDAIGATNAGYMYYEGRGTKQSYEKAAKYLVKAAEAGDAMACNHLGFMHVNGLGGLEKSETLALARFEQAAQLGSDLGATNAGLNYYHGIGTKQSDEVAAKYFLQASRSNHPVALRMLGEMHELGYGGLEHSDQKALECYRQALENASLSDREAIEKNIVRLEEIQKTGVKKYTRHSLWQ